MAISTSIHVFTSSNQNVLLSPYPRPYRKHIPLGNHCFGSLTPVGGIFYLKHQKSSKTAIITV